MQNLQGQDMFYAVKIPPSCNILEKEIEFSNEM